MKGKVLVSSLFVFVVLLAPNIVMAQAQEAPGLCYWRGYATVSGSAAATTDTLHAYVNGSLSATGYVRSSTTGFYEAFVNMTQQDNISFKICGVSVNETTFNNSAACDNPAYETINLTMTKLANGAACTLACGCTGGYCCSGLCSSSACSSGDSDDGSGGGSSGGAADDDVTETPITDTVTVNEILSGISAIDLGMTGELSSDDVDVVAVGDEATATATVTVSVVDSADEAATTPEADAAVEEIREGVQAGRQIGVSVSLNVYKVTSKETGQSVYVSKIKLSFTAANEMKDVVLVEVIPKSVAADIDDVVFLGESPIILQSDPIVKWEFPSVAKGQTKDLSYSVKQQLTSIESTTLAVAGQIISSPPQTTCTAGERRCSGNELQQCSNDGLSWNTVQTCEHGCDSAALTCRVPPTATTDNTMMIISIFIIIVIALLASVVYMKSMKKQSVINRI